VPLVHVINGGNDADGFQRPHAADAQDNFLLDAHLRPAAVKARRDFTVNAMAWGARPGDRPGLIDPYEGMADVERRVLRAVGEPSRRFEEDALRMIRAVRLATTLDFTIEAETFAALEEKAPLVAHLSGERIAAELDKRSEDGLCSREPPASRD